MFDDFEERELLLEGGHWPNDLMHESAVYVFCCNDNKTPFYIGQTKNFAKRMNNYDRGDFAAPTDFRIKTAIQFLKKENCKIFVKFKIQESFKAKEERVKKEREMIVDALVGNCRLINSFPGYNYKLDRERKDRIEEQIQEFCKLYVEKK